MKQLSLPLPPSRLSSHTTQHVISGPPLICLSFSLCFLVLNHHSLNVCLLPRLRSGNPGYQAGLPVLFGTQKVSGATMLMSVAGMELPYPSASCAAPSLSAAAAAGLSVGFGYDVQTGCVLSLNRSELQSLCCIGSDLCSASASSYTSKYSNSLGVPSYLASATASASTPAFIGTYGNADPLDLAQWQPLLAPASPPRSSRQWLEYSSTCRAMISGINYKFLVGYSGEKASPQNMILAASYSYSVADWTMTAPASSPSIKKSFPLAITVSFINILDQGQKGYTPPPPPNLFVVPYDVFYPF